MGKNYLVILSYWLNLATRSNCHLLGDSCMPNIVLETFMYILFLKYIK